MKWLIALLLFCPSVYAASSAGKYLEKIPVQDGGRIKPYGTFANEMLQTVYGRTKYNNKPATEVVFTWLLVPTEWMEVPIVQVRHSGLREALNLQPREQIYHSPASLMTNPRLPLLTQELANRQQREEKLNPYYQAIQLLQNQLSVFTAIQTGQYFPLAPSKDPEVSKWLSVDGFEAELSESFTAMTKAFIGRLGLESRDTSAAQLKERTEELKSAVDDFIATAKSQNPQAYDQSDIAIELHLVNFHPFMWSWIFYLLAAIFMLFFMTTNKKSYSRIFWGSLLVAFVLHNYGMLLRTLILERAPVTNMYETVVWVSWASVFFAVILHKFRKNNHMLLGACLISVLCLILTDLAPTVLDPSLQPLEAVLRDNFWLLTHVLVIVSSYGAFFLAFILGDILLFYYLKDENRYQVQIREGVKAIYRSLQIGVVLLALGTILGGVWADYSWGRFWGWDPKETWALIALLGYLAVLHGRLVGWIKNFGMAVTSILCFALVIMAWYGVNFVLGAGLHTYGFGAGGVEYVAGFVAIHILYVIYVATLRHNRLKNS